MKFASNPRFVFTFRFAFAFVLLAFEFVPLPLRIATSQNPKAPIASRVRVPNMVKTTVLKVWDLGGG